MGDFDVVVGVETALETSNGLPEAFTKLGQPTRAKDEYDDRKNEKELPESEVWHE